MTTTYEYEQELDIILNEIDQAVDKIHEYNVEIQELNERILRLEIIGLEIRSKL